MACNKKRESKRRKLAIWILNGLKGITTCFFSFVISILELIGIIVEQ